MDETMVTPPRTLSEILNLGIESMRGLDRLVYRADHAHWHKPDRDEDGEEVCRVCLAGAVMARVFNSDPNWPDQPSMHASYWEDCLRALEEMRLGQVATAANRIGVPVNTIPDQLRYVNITESSFKDWEDTDIFLDEMETLRDTLIKEGL